MASIPQFHLYHACITAACVHLVLLPQLLKLYKKRKTGSFGEKMEDVLMAYEEQDKNITAARTAALAGLPLYLKEDSTEVFKTCKDELEATQEGAVALVAVVNEDKVPAGVPFETHHVYRPRESSCNGSQILDRFTCHFVWTDLRSPFELP
ncbi:Uncharacterized protein IRJ41_014054 [Triplophysa rosa]|uniref:Uncharacterized protein n=1 Tax=Triplophysa rosa TaxID=992332 RepID=A0A9W7WM27_TRIRA|nr:Uncharacterized protein IRJ41_014054 [Triplophysa rosa]